MENKVADKVCEVSDCEQTARSKSAAYCEKHYMRLRRKGHLKRDFQEPTGHCSQCQVECNRVFCSGRCQTRFFRFRSESERFCKKCSDVIPPTRRLDAIFCSKSCGMSWRYNNDPEARERTIASAYRRKKGMTGRHTAQEWKKLLELCGNKCLACGALENLTRDHIVPIKKGGTDDISNLQPLCRSCNSKKQTKTVDYRTADVLQWSLCGRSEQVCS